MESSDALELRNVFFIAPLMVGDDENVEARITLAREKRGFSFEVESRLEGGSDWQLHAQGDAIPREASPEERVDLGEIASRCDVVQEAANGDRLHALAEQWFAQQPADHTLQPTALVHEAYLRLAGESNRHWRGNRTHVFALAARAMRQVLIDYARRRSAAKRGRSWGRVTLSEAAGAGERRDVDLIALSEALDKLAHLNERQCRIVELRFLAGLTVEETAEALGVSPRTVKLDWRMARAWLLAELSV